MDQGNQQQHFEHGSSLESAATVVQAQSPDSSPLPRTSLMRFNRRAFLITGVAVSLVLVIGLIALLTGSASSRKQEALAVGTYEVGPLAVQGVAVLPSTQIGKANQLEINGQLQVNSTLVISPTKAPVSATAGQIYYDQNTNQPYYFNGTEFVSLAPKAVPLSVTSIGGASGVVRVGTGLQLIDGQLGLSANSLAGLASGGVTSLQGKTGAVNFTGAAGISINGTTIANTGVINLTSTASQVTITQDGAGGYTLGGNVIGGTGISGQVALFTGGSTLSGSILSQSGGTVTAGGNLTVTGAITSSSVVTSSLTQAAAGSNVSISAGADAIVFTAGGRTFTLPTSGVSSQTICTTAISCAVGGGATVVLQPGTPEVDAGAGSSIAINNTGGGTLLQLQSNGSNVFVVNNNGSLSTLAVAGASTFNGAVSVNGNNSFTVGTGATSLGGALGVTGVTSLGSSLAVATNTTVGGTLNVTGITTLNGNTSVGGTGTFTTGSGTVKFGSLGAGIVQADATGVLSSGVVDRNSASFSSTLSVANGGTGAVTLTSNGLLYGNATGAVQATAAGTAGQLVLANALGVPTFRSLGGDAGVDSGGALTITKLQGTTLTISSLAAGQVVQYNGAGFVNGLITNTNLQAGNFTNITGTGALANGSITAGFGAIATANSITTTAAVQGATVTASGALQGNTLSVSGFTVSNTGAITAVSGIANSGGYTQSGSAVNNFSGATTYAGNLTQTGTGTFSTGTGAVTLGSLGLGLVLSNVSGALSSGALDRNNASYFNTALSVANGGTGSNTAAGARSNLGAAALGANGDITSLNAVTSVGATSTALTLQGNASSVFTATAGSFSTSLGFANPTANVSYLFQTAAAGSYNICTTVGNCSGVGGGVTTPGGTTGKIAKFTAGQTIADSLLSESGSAVTVGGTLAVNTIAPTAAFLLGVTSQNVTVQGAAVAISSTSGANTNTLSFATPAGTSHSISVPNASGTVVVSASGPLAIDANGNVTCATCTTSGGGTGGAVDSLNAINGAVTLQGTSNQIVITNNSGTRTITVSTPQDINTSSSPTFSSITASNNLSVTNAISAGSLSTSGNLVVSGSASITGAATAASYNGLSLTANATGFTVAGGTAVRTVAVTSNVTLDQNLSTTSAPSFAGLTSTGTLAVTGASTFTGAVNANGGVSTTNIAATGTVAQTGTGTFSTGTGLVNLNGNTTITTGRSLTVGSFGTGLVTSGAGGTLASGALDRNSASYFNTALTVSNGGTGLSTLTTNSILYATGTGTFGQLTGTSGQLLLANAGGVPTYTTLGGDATLNASGALTVSKLQGNTLTITSPTTGQYVRYNGTAFVNSSLQAADITGTLFSLAASAGTTQAVTTGQTVSILKGASGNLTTTAGATNTVTVDIISNPTFTGTVSATGAGGITIGVAGTTQGTVNLATTGAGTVSLKSLAQAANLSLNIPVDGNATDTICLLSIANCAGAGGGVTTSTGATNYVARFTGPTTLGIGKLYDNGTSVGVNNSAPAATNLLSINSLVTAASGAQVAVATGAATQSGLVIQGFGTNSTPSQTANLAEFQSSTGTVLSSIDANGNIVASAGTSIKLTGSTSFPTSPTEGQIYFRTDTKLLYVYANGKWQADRSTATKIVADGSTSQNPESADFVVPAGNTSAQTTINAAIATLPSGGGTIFLREGTYIVDGSVVLPNNVTLAGTGNATVLKFRNTLAPGGYDVIENSDTTSGTNITVKDLLIDGNRSNNTGSDSGIYFVGVGSGTGSTARRGAVISKVTIQNMSYDYGIYLNSSSNNTITDNFIKNIGGSGIGLYNGSNNNTISNNNVQGSDYQGFFIKESDNNTIMGNTLLYNNTGIDLYLSNDNTISGNNSSYNYNGFWLDLSSNNLASNNVGRLNGGNSFRVTTSDNNIISNNRFDDNGGSTTYGGIYLSYATSNTIANNSLTDTSCTTECYAIDLSDASSNNNYLSNNLFGPSTSTPIIHDLGTGTLYANQSTGTNGSKLVTRIANSTTAFSVQNASGSALLTIDSTNSKVVVAALDVTNAANLGGSLTVTGTSTFNNTVAVSAGTGIVATFSGRVSGGNAVASNEFTTLSQVSSVVAGAASNYIANGVGLQSSANFNIQAATSGTAGTVGGVIRGAAGGQTADLLQLQTSTGIVLTKFNANGDLSIGGTSSAASVTALQVLNTTGTPVLNVDTINSRTTLTGNTASDAATIGAELFTGANTFAVAAGWTAIAGTAQTATATHTAGGGTSPISPATAITVTAGSTYQVSFTISGATNVTTDYIYPSIGGNSINVFYGNTNQVQLITATTTGNLSFTPTTNWNGTISAVSVKLFTLATAVLQVKSSSGSVTLEVRTGGPATNNNSFIGVGAGQSNTTGTYNTAFGTNALQSNTTGSYNSASGSQALQSNTTGYYNTASGFQALQSNTTGSYNSASGYGALRINTTGSLNTVSGYAALYNNTTGSSNTVSGYAALYNNTTGSQNTALGYLASYLDGDNFTTEKTLQSATTLGANAQVQSSNSLILGSIGASGTTNVGIGTTQALNILSVEAIDYSTGAASQTGTTITGSSTNWTAAMIGDQITFADPSSVTYTAETITGFTSPTQLTASVSQTIANSYYRLHKPGLQVTSAGNVGVGMAAPSYNLDVQGTSGLRVKTTSNTATALQVQNAAGVVTLNVNTTLNQTTLNGVIANDTAVESAQLFTAAQSFPATTGWTSISGTGTSATASHTAGGGTTALSPTPALAIVAGNTYSIIYEPNGTTAPAESVTVGIGGTKGSAIYGNAYEEQVITATTTGNLTFTPTNNWVGQITYVQVTMITKSTSILNVTNSDASTALEVRGGGATNNNTFVGLLSGQYNIAAGSYYNTALGSNSLQHNTNGQRNTALGAYTLQAETFGYSNTAVGSQAAYSTTTGYENTAVGESALYTNTTGVVNVAIGESSLNSNTSGSYNVSVGAYSLQYNTSGRGNSALGEESLTYNTTGDYNNAVGIGSLYYNATGSSNNALGNNAIGGNGTGTGNTGIGDFALYSNYSGSHNTALGQFAGYKDPIVSAFQTTANLQNSTTIGYGSQVQASNSLILGGQGANAVNVGIGTTIPLNTFSVSPLDTSAGTSSQSGMTVTGTGTSFTGAMVGEQFIFGGGQTGTITAVASATSLTLSTSQTVFSTNYRIHRIGLQVTSAGNVGIGTTAPFAQLTVAGRVPTAATGSVATGSGPDGVYVQGRYAYVTNEFAKTLKIIDISNPGSPTSVGTVSTGGNPVGVYVQGRYAYVVSYNPSTLQIFDISNPATPTSVGTVTTGTTADGIYVQGRYAYLANFNAQTLQIFDISNPTNPTNVGNVATGAGPGSVYVQGRYAYVNNYNNNTLQIFDISNPASPTSVGTVSTGSSPISVYVQGRYAYVANYGGGSLSIIDVSNPASPTNVSTVATGINPYSVYVQGRYAYVANYGGGSLSIIDVSNPAAPISVGAATTDFGPQSVYVQGRYAYVANASSGTLQTFDIGGTYTQQLEVGGLETGTISSVGNATFNGTVAVNGGLTVSGSTELQGNVGVNGNINTTGTLTVSGTSTLNGNVTVQTATNSTAPLQVLNAAGGQILAVDTTNNRLNSFGNINLNQVAAPASAPTTADAGAGSLPAGTYYYVYTYVTPSGETEYGGYSSITIAANHNVLVTVANSPNSLVTAKKIYRAGFGNYQLVGTIANNTITTFTDSNTSPTTVAKYTNTTALLTVNGAVVLNTGVPANQNTFVGLNAGSNSVYGRRNSAVGYASLQSNTDGADNTAVGNYALQANTTGYDNTATGSYALLNNTSGTDNTAYGSNSLSGNTTGFNNTAVGFTALFLNTTGINNTAQGLSALFSNKTGGSNTANGSDSLSSNTTGSSNTANGVSSLSNLKTLTSTITATATNAGKAQFTTGSTYGLVTGAVITISGTTSYNGSRSVQSVDSGTTFTITTAFSTADATGTWTTAETDGNTATGYQAGYGNGVSYAAAGNSLYGYNSGYNLQTGGSYNTLLGYAAGQNITTGANNIIIGQNVNAVSATGSNQLNIGGLLQGDLAAGTAKFTGGLTLGTASTTSGSLTVANAAAAFTATIQSASYAQNSVLTIPATGATDTFCLLTLNNCSVTGVTSIGALDGGTANVKGASLTSNVLYLQSASSSYGGLVNTSAQTFAGAKTFSGAVTLQNATDSPAAFNINTSTGTSVLRVDTSNGRVGINNSSPAAPLDVVGVGPAYINGFESGTLSPFTTSDSSKWAVQSSAIAHAGSYALVGNYNGDSSQAIDYTSSVTQTLSAAGTVSFYYSCDWSYATTISFKIDSGPYNGLSSSAGGCNGSLSNSTSYAFATFGVASGTHTFTWRYNLGSGSGSTVFHVRIDDVNISNVGTTGVAALFNSGGVGIGLGTGNAPAHSLDVLGDAQFKSSTNSTTAFQVQNAAGTTSVIKADTTNLQTQINGGINTYNTTAGNLATLFVGKDTSGTPSNRSINAAGSINASGADYAEYIPYSGVAPLAGSIVSYQGSNYIVSSKDTAAFVGNDAVSGTPSILVTFAGQVPVRVTGAVNVGDILISNGDGTAKAVSPASASISQLLSKIAIAQEAATGTGVNTVQASVGTTSDSIATALQSQSNTFNDVSVLGTASINNLNVSGMTKLSTLQVMGSADIAGNLGVTGNITVRGSVNVGGDLGVTGNLTVAGLTNVQDIIVNGHIITANSKAATKATTSVAAVAAACTTGMPTATMTGNDTAGTVTITTGTGVCNITGALASITFATAYGTAPAVTLTPANAAAASLQYYYSSDTTTMTLNTSVKPTAGTSYSYSYHVIQ